MWVFSEYHAVKSYQKDTAVIEKRGESNEGFEKPVFN
jgi:hypothetical protein